MKIVFQEWKLRRNQYQCLASICYRPSDDYWEFLDSCQMRFTERKKPLNNTFWMQEKVIQQIHFSSLIDAHTLFFAAVVSGILWLSRFHRIENHFTMIQKRCHTLQVINDLLAMNINKSNNLLLDWTCYAFWPPNRLTTNRFCVQGLRTNTFFESKTFAGNNNAINLKESVYFFSVGSFYSSSSFSWKQCQSFFSIRTTIREMFIITKIYNNINWNHNSLMIHYSHLFVFQAHKKPARHAIKSLQFVLEKIEGADSFNSQQIVEFSHPNRVWNVVNCHCMCFFFLTPAAACDGKRANETNKNEGDFKKKFIYVLKCIIIINGWEKRAENPSEWVVWLAEC